MRSVEQVYLSLGSNLGERAENLERALHALEESEIRVLKRSSLYETEPQDVVAQPWFLNMAVEGETRLLPVQLLHALQRIEGQLGRVRGAGEVRRGRRVIDIDILLFGSVQMDTTELTIPHPRMLERRFVLEPLLEIAPDLRHPETMELLRERLRSVTGQKVQRAVQ